MGLSIKQKLQIRFQGIRAKINLKNSIKILLIFAGVCVLLLGVYKTSVSLYSRPKNVMITNITSSSATISWVTETPSSGVVYYDQKDAFLPWMASGFGHSVAYDDRDVFDATNDCLASENANIKSSVDDTFTTDLDNSVCNNVSVTKIGNYYVHYVTLVKLIEKTTYYFRIGDGFWGWDLGGSNLETFAKEESIDSPLPIFGKVVGSNGQVSEDAIVYVQFTKNSDQMKSVIYSSLTNSSSGWYLDGANIRSEDGVKISLEDTQDTLDAYGVFQNKGASEHFLWVFGQFDGAYPDLNVENNIQSQNIFNNILFKANAGTQNCAEIGWGNCAKQAAAANGGVLDATAMASIGLCGSDGVCSSTELAGNMSAITGQAIKASDVTDKATGKVANVKVNLKKKEKETDKPSWDYSGGNVCGSKKCSYTIEDTSKPAVTTATSAEYALYEAQLRAAAGGSPVLPVANSTPDVFHKTVVPSSKDPETGVITPPKTSYFAKLNGVDIPLESILPVGSDDYTSVVNAVSSSTKGEVEFKAVPLDIVDALQKDLNSLCDTDQSSCSGITKQEVEKLKVNPNFSNLVTAAVNAKQSYIQSTSDLETDIEKKVAAGYFASTPIKNSQTSNGPSYITYGVEVGNYVVANSKVWDDPLGLGKFDVIMSSQGGSMPQCIAWACSLDDAKKVAKQLSDNLPQQGWYKDNNLDAVPVIVDQGNGQYAIALIDKTKIKNNIKDAQGDITYLQTQFATPAETTVSPTPTEPGQGFLFNNLVFKTQAATTANTSSGYIFYLPEYGYYSLELGNFSFDQQTSSGKTIYLFYLEANGVDGFQAPKDPDNPKVGEDMIVKSAAYKIQLDQKATLSKYTLQKGVNIISFNFVGAQLNNQAVTAKDLYTIAKNQGVSLSLITSFSNGRWVDGVKCTTGECLGNDFPLTPGRGYLVVSDSDGDINIPAYNIKNSVPVALYNGWNLVGIQGYSKTYTASSLLDSINSISTIKADNVTWYPTSKSKYEGLQVSNDIKYGFDFKIDPKTGYFVRVNSITPDNKDCKSVIWNEGGTLNGTCGDSKSLF